MPRIGLSPAVCPLSSPSGTPGLCLSMVPPRAPGCQPPTRPSLAQLPPPSASPATCGGWWHLHPPKQARSPVSFSTPPLAQRRHFSRSPVSGLRTVLMPPPNPSRLCPPGPVSHRVRASPLLPALLPAPPNRFPASGLSDPDPALCGCQGYNW